MAVTPEIIAEVLRLYQANPKRFSPFKVSRSVGIAVSDVFDIIERNKANLSAAEEKYNGFGRPELQPFIVARRKVMERGWDNDLPEIITARAQYEAGTHIMCTGRDGSWLILYSVPRKGRPDPLPDYFLPEVA